MAVTCGNCQFIILFKMDFSLFLSFFLFRTAGISLAPLVLAGARQQLAVVDGGKKKKKKNPYIYIYINRNKIAAIIKERKEYGRKKKIIYNNNAERLKKRRADAETAAPPVHF